MNTPLREYVTDAIAFWERRRIIYNAVLAAVVLVHFAANYPSSKAVLSVDLCFYLFLMAVLANVAYCAAYVVDIFAQYSAFREVWQRCRGVLFAAGTAVAAILTRFVGMGMFGPVGH